MGRSCVAGLQVASTGFTAQHASAAFPVALRQPEYRSRHAPGPLLLRCTQLSSKVAE
jgi:hypothetical protein